MTPYQVLVVDDSNFMRRLISDLISEHPRYEVIATAKNGKEAIEKTMQYKPDVITMDIEMPEMNGLDALQSIMQVMPTPVLMLSSLAKEGARETILALERGAIDFIRKPSGSISMDLYKIKQLLYEKLDIVVQSKIMLHSPFVKSVSVLPREKNASSPRFDHIVAIGTSTGGPRALQQVISVLPADFAAPVLIVQHMPPNFTKSLAQRLDSISNIYVVEASDGMFIETKTAYIAPGGFQMTVYKDKQQYYRLRISKGELRSGHRPSVDTLFDSLVPFVDLKRHAVLMTGMGSDGAKGMLNLKESGAVSTIAEAEETCVVYGMPRAAVGLNGVMHILPQYSIVNKLILDVMHK